MIRDGIGHHPKRYIKVTDRGLVYCVCGHRCPEHRGCMSRSSAVNDRGNFFSPMI